jgi:hypothetical protein
MTLSDCLHLASLEAYGPATIGANLWTTGPFCRLSRPGRHDDGRPPRQVASDCCHSSHSEVPGLEILAAFRAGVHEWRPLCTGRI